MENFETPNLDSFCNENPEFSKEKIFEKVKSLIGKNYF